MVRKVKEKPVLAPEQVWVMAWNTSTSLGSVSHVSSGEKFYPTVGACQKAIDEMPSWIGIAGGGGLDRCRPLCLVRGW